MSNANGIVLSDFLGLSKPLTKLCETVACGIGKVYEPFHIKRLAKAKAKEIEVISEAICNNIALPIKYQDGAITLDTQDANNLIMRAQNRFLFQEMKKQQNIEAVVSNAYNELENVAQVDDTPVDDDWVSSFFDSVANISTEQMQQLWGRLLAGEIKRPGSFSLRTLETLKTLSQNEATTFEEVSPYILSCKGDEAGSYFDFFLMSNADGSLLSRHSISFDKIMLLSEAGLLSENSQITINFDIETDDFVTINGLNKALEIRNLGNGTISMTHPVYILTKSGRELLPITLTVTDEKLKKADIYLDECLEELKTGTLTTFTFKEKGQNKGQISLKTVDCK